MILITYNYDMEFIKKMCRTYSTINVSSDVCPCLSSSDVCLSVVCPSDVCRCTASVLVAPRSSAGDEGEPCTLFAPWHLQTLVKLLKTLHTLRKCIKMGALALHWVKQIVRKIDPF